MLESTHVSYAESLEQSGEDCRDGTEEPALDAGILACDLHPVADAAPVGLELRGHYCRQERGRESDQRQKVLGGSSEWTRPLVER